MTQRELGTEGGRERTPEEIEAEIVKTRAAIQQDMKSIGEKFTPEQFKDNAKGVLSDAKQEGTTMIRDAKDTAVGSLRTARDNTVEAVTETVHDLGDRAREAGAKASQYARQAGDYAREAGSTTATFVAANALPLSLIGLGVGWLVFSMRRAESEPRYLSDDVGGYDDDYYGREGEYDFDGARRGRGSRAAQLASSARSRTADIAHGAQDKVGAIASSARDRAGQIADGARDRAGQLAEGARDLADSARERVGELAEKASAGVGMARTRVSEAASHLGHPASALTHEARERLHRAQLRTRDFADENPLAVGAIAIAAGVGVGLLLPTTRPENRLMGATRDRLVGNARGLIEEARDAAGTVTHKAREAAQEIRTAATETRVSH